MIKLYNLIFACCVFFLLSGCSEQELAEIEYKDSAKGYFKSAEKPKSVIDHGDGLVSKKLDRSKVVKSESLKKKEIEDSAAAGAMVTYKEVHKFSRTKIDHDDYPETDELRQKNLNVKNLEQKIEKKLDNNKFIIVRSGDNLEKIAAEYNINQDSLAKANNLSKPYKLELGQILNIPDQITKEEQATETSSSAPRASPVVLTSPKSEFVSPVKGNIICSFGEEIEVGRKNEGVNFEAALGSDVYAAAAGVVIYASNQLEDYGNLVLIKHENALVTTYAHLQEILVHKGQKIVSGEIIGKVGSTGSASSPQLHFAVRKGKDAVDPMLYLPQ